MNNRPSPRQRRRLRSAAHAAALWLADAILADPELPADQVARQVSLMRLYGALARSTDGAAPLRLHWPQDE